MRLTTLLVAPTLVLLASCAGTPRPGPATDWHDLAAAEEAIRAGDEAEAIRLLEGLVARSPASEEPRRRLAKLLVGRDAAKAVALLEPLTAVPDPRGEDLLAMARARLAAGDLDGAEAELRRYTAQPGPPDPVPYVLVAEIAGTRREAERARDHARAALAIDPGNPDALRILLGLAVESGDAEAIAEARRALAESSPRHPALRPTP